MNTTTRGALAAVLVLMACDGADPTGTVDPVVATVEVTPPVATLVVGDTLRLTARVKNSAGEVVEGAAVQWTVDLPERMAAAPAGGTARVTALRAGGVRVTASAAGVSGEAVLSVWNPAPTLNGLAPAEAVAGGAAFQLEVEGSGFTPDSRVQWNGAERPTAFMSATRLRAGVASADLAAPGTATVRVVTAGPGGGASAIRDFTITTPPAGPVASVELDADSIGLSEGGTHQFTATVRDPQGTVLTGLGLQWSTGAEGIARVDAGKVTAIRHGRAVITVRVHGREASAVVRVKAEYDFDLVYSGWNPGALVATPYRMDLAGDGVSEALLFAGVKAGVLAPSPDGSRVAFSGETALQGLGLYVIGRDGSGLVRVGHHPGETCGQIAWRPDGQRLAYVCGLTGPEQYVVTAAADGSGAPVPLTATEPGRDSWPSWSPLQGGGYRIAYARTVAGEPRIFTMREDGIDHVQITSGMDTQPAWAPDGTTIAFQRTGAAIFGDIWLADAAGGNERSLTSWLAGPQWRPQWSPDGRLIAFASQHETYGSGSGVNQIYTMWADGSKVAKRTGDVMEKSEPSWLRH